jgi:hypothetical protein
MKNSIRIFILTSVPYGFFMGLYFGTDLSSILSYGLITGLIFGAMMTIILTFYRRKSLKKKGLSSDEAKELVNTTSIEISDSKELIIDHCINSIQRIKRGKIITKDDNKGFIKAKAGITWDTWGDTITFDIEELQSNTYRINILSRPFLKTTVIDYGKNLDNINRIMEYFKENYPNIKVTKDCCSTR